MGPVALGLVHRPEVHREGIELLAKGADVVGALVKSGQHSEALHAQCDRLEKRAEPLKASLGTPCSRSGPRDHEEADHFTVELKWRSKVPLRRPDIWPARARWESSVDWSRISPRCARYLLQRARPPLTAISVSSDYLKNTPATSGNDCSVSPG